MDNTITKDSQVTNQTATQDGPAMLAKAANAAKAAKQAKADAEAKLKESVISSLSFAERFELVAKSAKWADVLSAADALVTATEEAAKTADTPAKVARKVAQTNPTAVLHYRLAVASYSHAKSGINSSQWAELVSRFPALKAKGTMTDKSLTNGGLALFPLLGEV